MPPLCGSTAGSSMYSQRLAHDQVRRKGLKCKLAPTKICTLQSFYVKMSLPIPTGVITPPLSFLTPLIPIRPPPSSPEAQYAWKLKKQGQEILIFFLKYWDAFS